LCDVNDREQYEMILEMALETPWDEQTIHWVHYSSLMIFSMYFMVFSSYNSYKY
jgi:hypothetical protein